MSTPTITRRLEFDAGHRLVGHEGKCAHVHGHRYRAEVSVRARALDGVGRVIDFSAVKRILGGWIDECWDHGFIAEKNDPILEWLAANKMKHYTLDVPPTAEHLAEHLFKRAREILPSDIEVVRLRLYETPNCWADFPDLSGFIYIGSD